MSEIIITEQNFEKVTKEDKPVLIDFFATWCGPCRMLAPIIEEIAEERSDSIIVGKVDVDEQPGLASKFGVMSIPTVVLIKNGVEIDRFVGYRPKESIEEMLD